MKNDILRRGAALIAQNAVLGLLIGCFLLGGSSRGDHPAQIGIRVIAILVGAIALFFLPPDALRRVRAPLLFLAALLAIMVLQLVPLPPQLWQHLSGRDLASRGAELVGLAQIWRPTSFAPDATLNSALATLPGFAVLLLLGLTPDGQLRRLVFLFAILALLSGVLGLVQISSGQLYLYGSANRGGAVGLFANRNHQAAMLACLIPTLAALATHSHGRIPIGLRLAIAGALGIFVMPLVLITGSRAGILLLAVGCVGGFLLIRYSGISVRDKFRRLHASQRSIFRAIFAAVGLGLVLLVATLALSGRAVAINRLFEQDVDADARLRLFTTMMDMAATYFPFGAGFGTFPTIFKIDEPQWYLRPSYFNHAHNDILEVLIEGGVFSLALLAAFAVWWTKAAVRLWKAGVSRDQLFTLGRLGTVQTLILGLASVVDYPLRTPLGQAIFLIALVMMARAAAKVGGRNSSDPATQREVEHRLRTV